MPLVAALARRPGEKKSSCGGSGSSDAKMIGSYAQIRGNVPGRFCSPRINAAPPFEWPHATSVGITGDAEVLGDGEHVVGEAVPRVVGVGRVAVAVAAEVERPHVPARGNESFGDRFPHEAVKAGRVREQDGRAVAAPVVDDESDPVRVEVV